MDGKTRGLLGKLSGLTPETVGVLGPYTLRLNLSAAFDTNVSCGRCPEKGKTGKLVFRNQPYDLKKSPPCEGNLNFYGWRGKGS